jgi:hypothetical protein
MNKKVRLQLPIELQKLKTDYGYFLMNPIGDNLFIFSEEMMQKVYKIGYDLALYGDSWTYVKKS